MTRAATLIFDQVTMKALNEVTLCPRFFAPAELAAS